LTGRRPPPEHGTVSVIENRPVAADTFRLSLAAPGFAADALPGQFFMVSFPAVLDPLLPRPFAAFDREGGRLEILVRKAGRGTGLLAEIRPPAKLELFGPLGRGYRTELPPAARALVIAGGIGFASVHMLVKRLLRGGHPVTLLYGARAAEQIVPLDPDLGAHPGLDLRVATEDGGTGFRGHVLGMYRSLLDRAPDFGARHAGAFVCGPVPMLRAFAQALGAQGPPAQFSLEAHMACGYGVCQGCAVPAAGRAGTRDAPGYRRVCADGPVFRLDEVDWEALR